MPIHPDSRSHFSGKSNPIDPTSVMSDRAMYLQSKQVQAELKALEETALGLTAQEKPAPPKPVDLAGFVGQLGLDPNRSKDVRGLIAQYLDGLQDVLGLAKSLQSMGIDSYMATEVVKWSIACHVGQNPRQNDIEDATLRRGATMPAKTVSEEIKHLINDKGYSHDRAVAAALEMQRAGKLVADKSETEEVDMEKGIYDPLSILTGKPCFKSKTHTKTETPSNLEADRVSKALSALSKSNAPSSFRMGSLSYIDRGMPKYGFADANVGIAKPGRS